MAFVVANAENIPFVYRILSPSYFNALNGLNNLSSKKILTPDDTGFIEISNILIGLLREQNSPEAVKNISVKKFVREDAFLSFSTENVKEIVPIEVHLSNDQNIKWDVQSLSLNIEKLKTSNIFLWSSIVFAIGVLIQIIAYMIEKHRKKRPFVYSSVN